MLVAALDNLHAWVRRLRGRGRADSHALIEDDYRWVTAEIVKLAYEFAKGRIVSTLEGGYNLDALSRSTAERQSTSECSMLSLTYARLNGRAIGL